MSLLYIGLICTALSHVLWNKSLKLLPATTCSLFYPIQPLTSAVLAILVLDEKLTISFIIGAVLIGIGMIVTVYERKTKKECAN
jgi:drug/metabolite transporter (DMT)-like permease